MLVGVPSSGVALGINDLAKQYKKIYIAAPAAGTITIAGRDGGGHQAAEGEQGDVLALAADLALAQRQGVEIRRRHAAATATARITDHARAIQRVGGRQHRAAFRFVGRRHDHHVGNASDE